MNNFEKWDKKFNSQDLYSFNCNENGLLWLKTRALCRKKQMEQFLAQNKICLTTTRLTEQNVELFELLERTPSAMTMLNDFLKKKSHEWYELMGIDETKLKSESLQLYTLSEQLSDMGHSHIVEVLRDKRKEIVMEAEANPIELMAWLYSNQGEMRFGAENRLYLVLVDTTDMSQSWKMKRAFSLIEPRVNNYLNTFNDNSLKKISFTYKGDRYKTLSDIIFVIK